MFWHNGVNQKLKLHSFKGNHVTAPDKTESLIDYGEGFVPSDIALHDLYDSVGWHVYTQDPDALLAAVENSTHVVTAWHDQQLVGLARVVSDKFTIVFIQDILVHPDFRRRRIATTLIEKVLKPFAHVRQQVLVTDTEEGQRALYESVGFTEVHDLRQYEGDEGLRSFIRFND